MTEYRSAEEKAEFLWARVANPHRFNLNLDPVFHFHADPAPHESYRNMRPLVYGHSRSLFEPPGIYCSRPRPSTALFWAAIVSEFYMRIRIQLFTLMLLRIQFLKIMWIHADPDPKHWLWIRNPNFWFGLGCFPVPELDSAFLTKSSFPFMQLYTWKWSNRGRLVKSYRYLLCKSFLKFLLEITGCAGTLIFSHLFSWP
jgi:hypothetical protein